MSTAGALVAALVAILAIPVMVMAGFNHVKGLVFDA